MNQRMKFVIDLLTYVINAPVFIYVLCFCESTTIIFVITLIQFIFNLFILKAAGTNQGYYYLILLLVHYNLDNRTN